jgi:thiamine-monophosphate kinase
VSQTLQDLGERRIISDILPQFCARAGDDCAFVEIDGQDIVLTTDPVPVPAAKLIGGDGDLYWVGCLLVTINASDLAAAAATPVAFLSAIECSPGLDIQQFERLLEGIRDSCLKEGLEYIGGNLKESSQFAVTGMAVGRVNHSEGLRRSGARPGDLIFSVGQGGIFWRDVLHIINGEEVEKPRSPVFAPRSQLRNMRLLVESVRPSVSMDNSDGLLPTLSQLSQANKLGINLNLDSLSISGAEDLAVEPYRLWLGWGDWNVVIALCPDDVPAASAIAFQHGFPLIQIGAFTSGDPVVSVQRGERIMPAPRLESERFAKDSWFATGIGGYIELLMSLKLP